jgi:hypothetical protein
VRFGNRSGQGGLWEQRREQSDGEQNLTAKVDVSRFYRSVRALAAGLAVSDSPLPDVLSEAIAARAWPTATRAT